MTREELQDMITDEMYRSSSANKLTARILAALAREREGEVVLWDGTFGAITSFSLAQVRGKRGQLIFRPTKAEKGGE